MKKISYALALHGGAGVTPGRDYTEVERHLTSLITRGENLLTAGESALNVVQVMVAELEQSGLYVAGRGSAPNSEGYVEMDAAIMDGSRRRMGAVAALRDVQSPITVARAVMEHTPHVLLVGEGARLFSQKQGIALVEDPRLWYRLPVGVEEKETRATGLTHGTVGAVALDRQGNLAAATSTGGLFGKLAGRVGDTPIPGAGTWADDLVAVSCTGIGEAFMQCGVARDVAARMQYTGSSLAEAAALALDEIREFGADGGLIAIDREGNLTLPFNSGGMKRASVVAGAKPVVAIL